ncbi:MAG TPA: hypothetical protein PLJ08_22560 [Cyclobacteriaceae bacterium]|nr:hypothetical protein [Cyclobacteriaceae bacterium]
MKTLTIDILDDKALRLLQELELKNLIKVRINKTKSEIDWRKKYKGGMSRQSIAEIESQLKTLRAEWE